LQIFEAVVRDYHSAAYVPWTEEGRKYAPRRFTRCYGGQTPLARMKARLMTTYLCVCRSDAIGFISPEIRETFERSMRQALDYVRIKLSCKLATGAFLITPAPLGAVKNEADADCLIAKLRRELPGMTFGIAVQTFDAAAFFISCASLVPKPQTQVT
jgi:hypothetical protein